MDERQRNISQSCAVAGEGTKQFSFMPSSRVGCIFFLPAEAPLPFKVFRYSAMVILVIHVVAIACWGWENVAQLLSAALSIGGALCQILCFTITTYCGTTVILGVAAFFESFAISYWFRLASELDSGQDGFMPDEILGVDTGNGGHDSGSARLLAIIPIVGVTVLLISFVSGCIICYKWQRMINQRGTPSSVSVAPGPDPPTEQVHVQPPPASLIPALAPASGPHHRAPPVLSSTPTGSSIVYNNIYMSSNGAPPPPHPAAAAEEGAAGFVTYNNIYMSGGGGSAGGDNGGGGFSVPHQQRASWDNPHSYASAPALYEQENRTFAYGVSSTASSGDRLSHPPPFAPTAVAMAAPAQQMDAYPSPSSAAEKSAPGQGSDDASVKRMPSERAE